MSVRTPAGVRGLLAPLSGCEFHTIFQPGVARCARSPGATFHARLRRALQKKYFMANWRIRGSRDSRITPNVPLLRLTILPAAPGGAVVGSNGRKLLVTL